MNQIKYTIIFVITLLLIKVVANAETLKPSKIADFKRTSVRVYNNSKRSGGTGSILNSSVSGSEILTNKHVCRLIEQGGFVEQENEYYPVDQYKKFTDHDLCLIKVKHNFNVNIVVSNKMAKPSDITYVSGHPNLFPHIVNSGHLSDDVKISLIVGLKECKNKKSFQCMMFGGIPVIERFNAQVVSNLIKPGSSGSAVFNKDGELVGVVFAGYGRDFSYGIIVPQKYVVYFLSLSKYYPYVKTGTPVDDGKLKGRIFNYKKCLDIKKGKAKQLCNTVQDNMLYIGENND